MWFVLFTMFFITLSSCHQKEGASEKLFVKLSPEQTNIHFSNDLSYDSKFNIYTYRNFYNGGGVALGDFNNDGLQDIFFSANMKPNQLYLNKGALQFEDITEKAGIGKKGKWSTGVSVADINGDGWLDIYVCNSGDINGDKRENELYINNGNLTFTESAQPYGLDDKGLSTHAAFFDYDKDGDLDMFLLNNSFKAIGSFNLKENEREKRDSIGGDKLFRNDNNHFTDVSEKAGIFGSVIGFGLGVTVGDVNKDGWQDIYVSNDFFERDYLYINQQNGTFKEKLEDEMISISNASMGADFGDINNDANLDLFVTEMLPEDEGRIKTNTTFESWDKHQLSLQNDYYHQFTRNMLQLNNGNNTFSEIGRFAGVHATDWSWGALITDLDNDGLKDIFVANGIYQDLTNEDYIQYVSNEDFFKEVVNGKADYKRLIDLIPSQAVSNYAFSNNGDLTFTNRAEAWGLSEPSFSNGAAYGDLDNDGDLDLVVNNVNMPCFVYQNRSCELHPENGYVKVTLQGEGGNRYGLGSKVTLYYGGTLSFQEQMPVRGFESTVDHRLNFGVGRASLIDSVVVEWPDDKRSVLKGVRAGTQLTILQAEAAEALPSVVKGSSPLLFTAVEARGYGLDFIHHENDFVDFDRDQLIFHMLSTEGPRVAVGDVDGDGRQDVYLCGAKDAAGGLYLQTAAGHFVKRAAAAFEQDRLSEDTDALFFDADGDGDKDLFVCSGGNEFSPNATALISRLYFNEGGGKQWRRSVQLLPSFIFESASSVAAGDWDGDGDADLFVGVRLKPFAYGYPCKGYVLQNDGKGFFSDVTAAVAPGLEQAGMITDGQWLDYDGDGRLDLVVSGEYMPLRLWHNEGRGVLKEVTEAAGLGNSHGWWNRLAVADVNGDGYVDIVGANHGLNSRFKASREKPVRMYVSDFDGEGSVEQVVTAYNKDSSYPMALRHDLVSILPYLKKKYLKYSSYRGQGIEDIFTPRQLQAAVKLEAYELRSGVWLNNRKGGFVFSALPTAAQLSPMYGIAVGDWDGDGKMDMVMGGNFYGAKPEVGIYDASYGVVLKGNGKGGFAALPPQQSGLLIHGQVRDMALIQQQNKTLLLVAKNNEAPAFYKLNK